MNFVAHQLLSFDNTEIQIGNLFGEVIRGKDFKNFKGDRQKGILLHRQIDTFTDDHDIVKKSTQKFHERYGKYAPVIVDVIYDYLLILNWKKFSEKPYNAFVKDCYDLFQKHYGEFTADLQFMVNHMVKHDWFGNYATAAGIRQTLKGISQRSKFENNISTAVEEMEMYQEELNSEFLEFFPQLIIHCKTFINS